MKETKVDDLSEEELRKFLADNEKENQHADDDASEDEDANKEENYEHLEIVEEITILPPKEKKKKDKKESKEQKKVEKLREQSIKKRRKSLKRHPSTLNRYEPDPNIGLTNDIVEDRIIDEYTNVSIKKKTKSVPKIIFTNIVSFFNIMMFLIAAALIAVGAYQDLIFLIIITCNILIGIIQEIKAKNMIDSLSLMSAPTAIVIRDGNETEIPTDEVVLDDIMVLETGAQICADSIVVEGSLEVNESLLTGESDAVIKQPGDKLYSGSYVVSGKCKARVDSVGKDNYIEKLSSQVRSYKKPKSDLLKSLSLIIKVMAVPVIVLGGSLFFIMYYRSADYSGDIVNCIRKTAGAMVGMIPSGLFLMSSIALMVGVIRLGQRNVLVQELYCIEMLARVNCICLDKTGTITDGTMVVKNVIDYNTINGLATRNIVSAMLNALPDRNLTSQALKAKFGLGKRMKHIAAIPFSSQRKLQAVTFDKYGTYILGAPEFILKEEFARYKKDVDKYANLGYRVLCLAHNEGQIIDNNLPEGENIVISMILIEDTIRPDAINTIRYFKESGVEVRVISGDNPITVSKIAQRAGIVNAHKYISLDGMSDNDVMRAALRYTVFGRVSPKQKQILIKTLKSSGRTVAMTGDGVNDILALREADCSIAIASGSAAARNCSHLVLLDSNFDSMPYVVSEGRRVINNVTKVSSLFLTKTIFSLFLAIQAVIIGTYPISTNQLFMIDTLAIGLPSLLLVNEPNNNPVKGRFLYNVIREALPGALTILLLSIIVFSLSSAMYLDSITRNTIIIVAATHTCLMVLFKACRPFNTMRKILCTVCYSLFLFGILILPRFFEIRPMLSFSSYYSSDYESTIISHYPSVDRSVEGFYVADGKITSISAITNSNSTDLYVVDGDPDNKNESNKIYYSFSPESTIDGTYDKSLRLDMQVNLPILSYTENGHLILGGYEITNKSYHEGMTSELRADKNGKLYFGDDPEPIKIKLTESNDYYNYEVKYGVYDETQAEFEACIMPVVEIINNKYVIKKGEQPKSDEQYNVPASMPNLNQNIVLSLEKYGNTNSYVLLVNGDPIYATSTKDNKTSKTPYLVNLPNISTVCNKQGSEGELYLCGVDSGYSIFEIYGTKQTVVEDDVTTTTYSLTNLDDEVYSYNPLTSQIIFDDEDVTSSFTFKNLGTKGFKDFKDYDSNPIDIYKTDSELSIYVDKEAKNYSTMYSLMNYSKITNTYSKIGTGLTTKVSINYVSTKSNIECSIKPNISITEADHYIIDGYYTPYVVTNNTLNPVLTDDHFLVIGGVKTDYKLADNYVRVQKGGFVSVIPLSSLIFLLMLCLLSAPVMKLFQYSVPWISNASNYIKVGLNKIGSKEEKNYTNTSQEDNDEDEE